MALDKEYFDSIHIDVVKKKYYNANKVEAVFQDIRRQAEALNEENEQMRTQLEALNGKTREIGDAVLTAQAVYKQIVNKARERAAQIIADAEAEKAEIIRDAMEQQEYAVKRVQNCYEKIQDQHSAFMDAINSEWQEFLCGLYTQDGEFDMRPPKDSGISQADIESKVGNIAKALFSDDD